MDLYCLPLRSTYSQLGPMPPLCLLLAMICLQQQWTTLCLFLVCIFFLNSIFNCLTVVTGGSNYEAYDYGSYDYGSSSTYYDEILLYNPAADSWTPAGKMSKPREGHAVTVLRNIENICRS